MSVIMVVTSTYDKSGPYYVSLPVIEGMRHLGKGGYARKQGNLFEKDETTSTIESDPITSINWKTRESSR
jgi:hypothetical protein